MGRGRSRGRWVIGGPLGRRGGPWGGGLNASHTFGAVGMSKGLWYEQHLAHMMINKEPVDWKKVVSSSRLGKWVMLLEEW